MTAVLHVRGTPRPKQSARWVNGRAVSVVATRQHLKTWTAAIVAECRRFMRAGGAPFAGPVAVTMTFYFESKDAARHGRPHTHRPDADNLAKACADALQAGGMMADDAKIADCRQVKLWALAAGAVIQIRPFGAPEPAGDMDDDLGVVTVDGSDGLD